MAFGRRSKGGSSTARAARARKGHQRRKSKPFAAGKGGKAPYMGGHGRRTKNTWLA
jgi:hypothetical protein